MFRSYFAAAFGNLARNWLYAGVTVLGLAVSFAAAILIGLYVRDEYSFERFIPDYQRVYRLEFDLTLPGQKPRPSNGTVSTAAANFRIDFPEAEQVARLGVAGVTLKQGQAVTRERVAWADTGFFKIMALPVLAGDANAALEAPDGLVLTREMARKYFGQDAPIGRTILVNSGIKFPDQKGPAGYHLMRVLAVLKDIPSNTHLAVDIFAAARSPYSMISFDDRFSSPFNVDQLTYVRLKPGVSADALSGRVRAFGPRRYHGAPGAPPPQHFRLMPLRTLHFTATDSDLRPPGDRHVDAAVAAVGVLIVVIAAINFVTLMTARATRRAVEVGVRKAAGARRGDLIAQFMGEALIYVLLAVILAAALAELILPRMNAFLQRTLVLNYLTDPALTAAIVGGALLTAVLAGAYPSFVLSAFQPASALKGGATQPAGSGAVGRVLVVVQFAILIGLIVMTATIYRQTRFAIKDALRLDTSQVAMIPGASRRSSFATQVSALPGVKSTSCGSAVPLGFGDMNSLVNMPDRSQRTVQNAAIDVGFFEMHGLTPLAGRFFARGRGEDMVLDRPNAGPDVQPSLVLNETAARLLGFARPADAVGQTINWTRWSTATGPALILPARPSQVVGVVPDFTLGSVRTRIKPTFYFVDPSQTQALLVKLDGHAIPDTLAAINRLWPKTGADLPANVFFEDQSVQSFYQDVITQGVVIAICAGLAIFIACIGLFALAAFTTERRTKEIGVRKAMGASTQDVVKLLLWQFTQPVLWANLIAWPAAWWVMDQWLHGFAYRVDLPVWLFVAATLTAAVIAWATVSFQSWMVARAKPVTALRYE
jgi:putative ABC transport system permease protein